VRLPAVVPLEAPYPGMQVSYPGSAADLLQAPGENRPPDQPERPPDARDGVFQKLIFDGTWLAPGGNDGLGLSLVETKTVLAFPVPSREYPLIVTPGFAVRYFDGPAAPDVPPRVYDAYAQFRWMRRLSSSWGIDLAVTPGVFSDFEQSTDEALRITGHGVLAWTCSPRLKLAVGVAYLDREDLGVLPVGGLIWTPRDDVRFELVAPRPRIARRIYWAGHFGDEVQDWIYIAGELGGGTWAVARANGTDDVLTYRDWRALLGVERKVIGGLDTRFEVGYVFSRSIEYTSGTPDFDPPGTVLMRGVLTY